jgi:hypothetical protein
MACAGWMTALGGISSGMYGWCGGVIVNVRESRHGDDCAFRSDGKGQWMMTGKGDSADEKRMISMNGKT